ncbi:ATP-binding protein [Klebsiella quasipneumoniae]
MLLKNVTFLTKSINLANDRTQDGSNVITILTGNNSSGKSRILQTICSTFIHYCTNSIDYYSLKDITNLSYLEQLDNLTYTEGDDFYSLSIDTSPVKQTFITDNNKSMTFASKHPYHEATLLESNVLYDKKLIDVFKTDFLNRIKNQKIKFKPNKNGEICSSIKLPNKILAVTGSPYDKFPFKDSYSCDVMPSLYFYLGSRGKERTGPGKNKGYLGYKFDQIGSSFIKLLLKPKREYFDFSKMLEFLNISNSFTMKLIFRDTFHLTDLNQERIINLIESANFCKRKDTIATTYENKNEHEKKELSIKILEAIKLIGGEELNKFDAYIKPINILYKVDLSKSPSDKRRLDSLDLLTDYGLIELEDIIFSKPEKKQNFLLSQASSGELSLLFTMSSIASVIENGSLILIDEPEISLHPKWQIDFLPLLSEIFSNYKSCHFIIATHSPTLISSVQDNDAYIVSIEDNESILTSSAHYHNRSVDFQLAEVFDSPGNNNEYLLSQVIETLDKLCKFNEFDDKFLNKANWLLSFEKKVKNGDKVKTLLDILKKTLQEFDVK